MAPVTQKAFITGVAGLSLSSDEQDFLATERPLGLILFARNCRDREQIAALVRAFRLAIGTDDVLVLIDQEGGRVQRLRPPLSRALPPAAALGRLYRRDRKAGLEAALLIARLTAEDLLAFGINTSCAPVLDVPVPGADGIIGDRAYGDEVATVVALGGAVARGLMDGGVLPVIKHIPGHGRADADSHLALPKVGAALDVLEQTDFATFHALRHLPAAMTAHVLFTAIDAEHPASTSAVVTQQIMRAAIGFDGLLMSDDLSMKALTGRFADRAKAVFAAGSDVALHCNGDLAEMREVAAATPWLAGRAAERAAAALAVTHGPRQPFDRDRAESMLEGALGPLS